MWCFSLFCLAYLNFVSTGFLTNIFDAIVDNSICIYKECCIDKYVPLNVEKLETDLKNKVFGQPLANKIVQILEAHRIQVLRTNVDITKASKDIHGKALAVSFHGWPGNGKNYVVSFIVEALYTFGWESKYVKFYTAMHDFPDKNLVNEYKRRLKKEIIETINQCGTSLFIFDEVEKMAPGILDAIKPFIDHYSRIENTVVRNSIFIFLSNYAGEEISLRLQELYQSGLKRNEIKMFHFEQVIRKASFLDSGGFQNSAIISGQLLDHYIPFLPMEQSHVRQCILSEFMYQGCAKPTEEMIAEVMKVITFGPTREVPIFANAGCKRIKREVAFVLQNQQRKSYKYTDEL